MLVAKTIQGKLLYAWQASYEDQCFCPQCGQRVLLRAGQLKSPYFAHSRQSDCVNSEGETNQHLAGKRQMWQWTQERGWDPQLEVYLPAVHQRPDLLLTWRSKKIAMEFQCSPLSCQRLMERNQGYRQLKMGFIWYLGPNYCHKLRSSKRAQFVQQYGKLPAIFLWNLKRHCPEYHVLHFACLANRLLLTRQLYCLQRYTRANMHLRIQAYRAGQRLNCCPLVTHCYSPTPFLMKESDFSWRLSIILWLGQQPLHSEWNLEEWYQALSCHITWQVCPCLTTTYLHYLRHQQLKNFTCDLMASQIIKPSRVGFYLFKHPIWFRDESAKLQAIIKNKSC